MSQATSEVSSRAQRQNGSFPVPARRIDAMSVSDEAIAKRAYEKFEGRGCTHGHDQEDWATATQELTAEAYGQYGVSTRQGDF